MNRLLRILAVLYCCGISVLAGAAQPQAAMNTGEDSKAGLLAVLLEQAVSLEHGEGVPQDYKEAAALYCYAARLGQMDAQFNLGWMYTNGRGLERDDGLAAYFFGLAAKQGHEQARNMLRLVGNRPSNEPECMKVKAEPVLVKPEEEPPQKRKLTDLVHKLAAEYAINPRLALAVISIESNFQDNARSPKNAQGLMQLIPETAARFNVKNPFDPEDNLRGGLAYLRWLLAYFEGDVALALAGYNAGEGAVDRHKGVPPYTETRNYVRRILEIFPAKSHPFNADIASPSSSLPAIRAVRGVRG